MSHIWFVRRGGKEAGPFSPTVLKQLADSGGIRLDDEVRREGRPGWVKAKTVRGLFTDVPSATVEATPVLLSPKSVAADSRTSNVRGNMPETQNASAAGLAKSGSAGAYLASGGLILCSLLLVVYLLGQSAIINRFFFKSAQKAVAVGAFSASKWAPRELQALDQFLDKFLTEVQGEYVREYEALPATINTEGAKEAGPVKVWGTKQGQSQPDQLKREWCKWQLVGEGERSECHLEVVSYSRTRFFSDQAWGDPSPRWETIVFERVNGGWEPRKWWNHSFDPTKQMAPEVCPMTGHTTFLKAYERTANR
jgi:hypothetical protein